MNLLIAAERSQRCQDLARKQPPLFRNRRTGLFTAEVLCKDEKVLDLSGLRPIRQAAKLTAQLNAAYEYGIREFPQWMQARNKDKAAIDYAALATSADVSFPYEVIDGDLYRDDEPQGKGPDIDPNLQERYFFLMNRAYQAGLKLSITAEQKAVEILSPSSIHAGTPEWPVDMEV